MKYLKLLQLKLLLWFCNVDETETNEDEEKFWLKASYRDPGFRSYCKVRNIEILKQIAMSVEKRDFQRALELNGSRLEILKIQIRAQIQYKKSNS